jgi:hypothetical protein
MITDYKSRGHGSGVRGQRTENREQGSEIRDQVDAGPSTSFGAEDAPNSAQDDKLFRMTSYSG